jgi:two-component system cell cycle response regulator DivK
MRPKILLVDDNRLFLEMEKEFLQSCSVKIYTARSGQEALDIIRMVLPDLIFMDLHMPGMDGDVCCAAIKSDVDLKAVPVVMITSATEVEDLERCRLAGCDLILAKPVNRSIFIRTGLRFLPGFDRVELRIPCLTLVVFRMREKPHYGTSSNLSSSGIFIAFDGDVELDDMVRLSFIVPGADDDVVEVTGRIAWKNFGTPLLKHGLPRGFGVEFSSVSPQAERSIADFINRAEERDYTPLIEEAYLAEESF